MGSSSKEAVRGRSRASGKAGIIGDGAREKESLEDWEMRVL
jgi:hypothetical protein